MCPRGLHLCKTAFYTLPLVYFWYAPYFRALSTPANRTEQELNKRTVLPLTLVVSDVIFGT